jgi:trk system potassium uptake protein
VNVIIAGAGRLGGQTAQVLAGAGHQVTVVDLDEERLTELAATATIRPVPGDACEPAVLQEAGAHAVDLLLATTGTDEDNLVIALTAKRRFAVVRVAARVNVPENAWLCDSRWGVDIAVPAAAPLISLIEEATGAADTVALLRLSRAGVTVIETAITAGSPACDRTLDGVRLPAGTVVAALIREGVPITAVAGTRLRAGDELLIISRTEDLAAVGEAFH